MTEEPIDLPVTADEFFADVEQDLREMATVFETDEAKEMFASLGIDPEAFRKRALDEAEEARRIREAALYNQDDS